MVLVAFVALDLAEGKLTAVLAGEIPFWLDVEVRSAVVCAVLLAGLVATHRVEELGIARDLERLAPLLSRETGDPEAEIRAATRVDPWRLRVAWARC